jgi:hypothetical protein
MNQDQRQQWANTMINTQKSPSKNPAAVSQTFPTQQQRMATTDSSAFNLRTQQNLTPVQDLPTPTEFVYQYDMDENGALFYLATYGR